MKTYLLYISILIITGLFSCKPFQLAIPTQFTEQATKMDVKGWKGYKQLEFGNYKTSKVKRGLLKTNTRPTRRSAVTTEERLLKVFKIESNNVTETKRDRFHYTINDGNRVAEVLATEGDIRQNVNVKTGSRWLGNLSVNESRQYAFSAIILPITNADTSAWNLMVYNGEHPRTNEEGRRGIFRFPLELGYATNGIDTVTIKQIRVTQSTTPKGKEGVIPFEVPGGYELRMDDGVVAMINQWNHEVWIYNDLDEPTKLLLSAIASSLMLRKIHSMK